MSKAVQASTALPGLYRPVRIEGRDFVDGGVKKTAHINLAIQKGADLVICVNPIVPIDNRSGALSANLSSKGVTYVLDQVLRIALHGRMQYGLERYKAEHPEVDILLLEPTRDDLRMFSYNIMQTSARKSVAAHAYRSTVAVVHGAEGRAPAAAPPARDPPARSAKAPSRAGAEPLRIARRPHALRLARRPLLRAATQGGVTAT